MAMEVAPSFPTWEEIELAENYMVCCMYQEAAALSSSIIEQLVDKNVKTNERNCEFGDMLESAAMILVQSYKALGRTSEMLKQLKVLFGSVTAIPAQVFLTGIVKRQASSTKKALVDFWQLAFSYQVNPLAAVQPLPPATRGSR
ncbi:protein APEM9-like isoform X2 [Solanum pennellii]|uniref:Protein APEM9-like isoform X2 n=1 Tax=Solanum pennellii TaxID=28526 RepID=A0ABM1FPT8_SOLPN|nr:protein APEM9-like isoform X2 [Solanum pennellii]